MRMFVAGGCVAVMGIMGAPALHADAKGSVNLSGASFTVVDAVAYKANDGIELAFLPAALDRKEAAKDRKLDIFDLMHGDGRYVALIVGADGSFNCINYSTGKGGGSSCNSSYTPGLTFTTRTPDRVVGRFHLTGDGNTADVTFDLKVESALAPPGTPLPAGGGDPGKAVLAHFAAIEKNDFKALKATAQPEQRAMMEAAEKSGEAKEMFEMMRAMSPRKVKLVGGTVDGDDAIVDFEAVEDGKPVKGYAEVVRVGGVWYMTGSSTRQ